MAIKKNGDLQVDGNIWATSANNPLLLVRESGLNYGIMQWDSTDKYLTFSTRENNSMYSNMLTLRSGNVGIGKTSPSEKLHVNGRVRSEVASGFLQMNNYFTGANKYLELTTTHGPWGISMWASSKRFKDDIRDLELDSSKIYDLRPVSFHWNEDRGGGKDFGLIAEDVEEIFPSLVSHDKDGKAFSVRYGILSVLLLNELKKKEAEISSLNETVENLKVSLKSESDTTKLANAELKQENEQLRKMLTALTDRQDALEKLVIATLNGNKDKLARFDTKLTQ